MNSLSQLVGVEQIDLDPLIQGYISHYWVLVILLVDTPGTTETFLGEHFWIACVIAFEMVRNLFCSVVQLVCPSIKRRGSGRPRRLATFSNALNVFPNCNRTLLLYGSSFALLF